MNEQTYVFEPRVYPIIKSGDTDYVVDLKRGHFRRPLSPFEVVEFESEPGRSMCAAVGAITCSICKVRVMHHGVPLGLYCIRCGHRIGTNGTQPEPMQREEPLAVVET